MGLLPKHRRRSQLATSTSCSLGFVIVIIAAKCCFHVPTFLPAGGNSQPAMQSRRQLLGMGGLFAASALEGADMRPAKARDGRLPPIDAKKSKKDRCKYKSSSMGQANAARDKILDLRECNMEGQSASKFDIAGALMNDGNFANSDYTSTTMTKIVAERANFDNAVFTDAICDRIDFNGASLKNVQFRNTELFAATFDGANLEGADFTDATLGEFQIINLCSNPTMKGKNAVTGVSTYKSAGCDEPGAMGFNTRRAAPKGFDASKKEYYE